VRVGHRSFDRQWIHRLANMAGSSVNNERVSALEEGIYPKFPRSIT
jgi:hypothetical protein